MPQAQKLTGAVVDHKGLDFLIIGHFRVEVFCGLLVRVVAQISTRSCRNSPDIILRTPEISGFRHFTDY
jgi:hypothetical protein